MLRLFLKMPLLARVFVWLVVLGWLCGFVGPWIASSRSVFTWPGIILHLAVCFYWGYVGITLMDHEVKEKKSE